MALPGRKLNEPVPGVLVVRSKGDFVVDEADLAKGLDRNNEINVHWGGEGGAEGVGSWSEGCQVITGVGYLNHHNQPIDCSKFVAAKFSQLGQGKTKGAYNVLNDVVAALSSDSSNVVKYMLLVEEDLALSPEIGGIIAQAREHARKMF